LHSFSGAFLKQMGEELNKNLFVDDQGALSAGSDDEIYV
jgi:hypothetical protein